MKDEGHLARVRQLPCCVCSAPPPSEPHHRTGGGMGLKTSDHETMPLCRQCHREFHDLNGYFKGWTKPQLRQWQRAQVRAALVALDELRMRELAR